MARGQQGDADRRLVHLTGARCLASAWIVCGHFLPLTPTSAFTPARFRGNVGVNFFVVMSGFITHWAYGSRILSGFTQVRNFYVRRIGRVVLTTWVAMSFGVLVVFVQLKGEKPDYWHFLRCYTFLETWRDPVDWCPNGQTWTVAALLPCWFLYPVTRSMVAAVEQLGATAGLILFGVLCWLSSFGPVVAFFMTHGHWITEEQNPWTYVWPPTQLGDFALGVVTATLAGLHARDGAVEDLELGGLSQGGSGEALIQDEDAGAAQGRLQGWFADVSMLLVLVGVFAVPYSGAARQGWEPLFCHAFAPLFACFLYGSATAGGAGYLAKFLRADALVALGTYSFEVYLFQWPVHEMWVAIGDLTQFFNMRDADHQNNNAEGFMVFILSLWLLAGLYMENVESPLVQYLRSITAEKEVELSSPRVPGSDLPRDGPTSASVARE